MPLEACSTTSGPSPSSTLPPKPYTYTPNTLNIFTPSPYKTHLLPLWRFKTPAIARKSAEALYSAFLNYEAQDDFAGMDNARKFLQMGMTRAARYANYKGGRKYFVGGKDDCNGADEEGDGDEEGPGLLKKNRKRIERGKEQRRRRRRKRGVGKEEEKGVEDDWDGRREKQEASRIFRDYWNKAKNHQGYVRRKQTILKRQKEWEKSKKAEEGRAGEGNRKRRDEE